MNEVTTITKRRVTFNLNSFIEDLFNCLLWETYDRVDDTVQLYKDFLSHTNENIRIKSISYVNNHSLVTDNEEVRSFIKACHKPYFEK